MKRFAILTLAVYALAMGFAATASAQNNGLALWFDERAHAGIATPAVPYTNQPGAPAGGRGSASVLYLMPKLPSGNHIVGANDLSKGALNLYMDVTMRATAAHQEKVSSVGLDINLARQAGGAHSLLGGSYVWNTTQAQVGGGAPATPWSGTDGTTALTGAGANFSAADVRAVSVPVSGSPAMYDTTIGLGPGGPYQIGKLNCECDVRVLNAAPSTYDVKLVVSPLLITRVYNPAAGAGPTPELPDFGRAAAPGTAAGPEAASVAGTCTPPVATGSCVGTTSTTSDASVVCRMQCDQTGEGSVNNADFGGFLAARTASGNGSINRLQQWLWDGTGEGVVNNADFGRFLQLRGQ